jgi:hypothetical protein
VSIRIVIERFRTKIAEPIRSTTRDRLTSRLDVMDLQSLSEPHDQATPTVPRNILV